MDLVVSRNARIRYCLAMAVFLLCTGPRGWSQVATTTSPVTATDNDLRTLRYHRVFIPQDRLEDFEESDWFPLTNDRFNELIKIANNARDPFKQQQASFAAATYHGTLDEDNVLSGTVDFSIDFRSSHAEPIWLGNCNLVLRNPHWLDAAEQPYFGTSPDGRPFLLVKRGGKLRANWTLATSDDSAEMHFPATDQTTLQINAASGMWIRSNRGIISEMPTSLPNESRWRLLLGAFPTAQLRWERGSVIDVPLVQYRQANSYLVSPRGVGLATELRIRSNRRPLRRFELRVPAELQVLSATFAGEPLSWQRDPDNNSLIKFELSEPIGSEERVIEIITAGIPTLGRSWELPTVSPREMNWQEGKVDLAIEEPLALQQLLLKDCRQVQVRPLPAPNRGEGHRFQLQTPDGKIALQLGRLDPDFSVRRGTIVTLSSSATLSETTAEFGVPRGEFFNLSAHVRPDWQITDVQAVSGTNEIADWKLNADRLKIRLVQPITPNNPVHLKINARHRGTAEGDFQPHEFIAMEFDGGQTIADHICFRTFAPFQLSTQPNAANQANIITESDLIEIRPGDFAVELRPHEHDVTVSMRKESARFDAILQVTSYIEKFGTREEFHINCESTEGNLHQIIVHLTEERQTDPEWSFIDDPQAHPIERKLTVAEQAEFGLVGGQTWELSIPPRSKARLLGKRFVATQYDADGIELETNVSLAVAVGATTQSGTATVYNTTAEACSVTTSGALSPGPTTNSESPHQLLSFHTYSADVLANAPPTKLVVNRSVTSHLPKAWIWLRQQYSVYAQDGQATHRVTYRIENQLARSFRIQIPPIAKLQRILVNGSILPQLEDVVGAAKIPLPAAQRFVVVQCDLTSKQKPLAWIGKVIPPTPDVDLQVLDTRSTIILPRNYHANHQSLASTLADRATWPIRLFGRRARANPRTVIHGPNWERNHRIATEFLHHLHSTKTSHSLNTQPLRWGELLQATEQARGTAAMAYPIRIDTKALLAAGIDSTSIVDQTLIRRAVSATANDLLDAHGLALCISPHELVLTSTARVALLREAAIADTSGIFHLTPDNLACQQLVQQSHSPSIWQGSLESLLLAGARWQQTPPSLPRGARAWEGPTDLSAGLAIHDTRVFSLLGWLSLTLVVCVGVLAPPTRWLVLLIGLLGTATLVASPLYLPMLRGGLWGCVLVGLRWWFTKTDNSRRQARIIPSTVIQSAPSVIGILILTICHLAWEPAARADARMVTESKKSFSVLIRVDEDNQPVDNYVFVPLAFYDRLLRIESEQTRMPFAWWLRSASYRCTLPDSQDLNNAAISISSNFQIETLRRGMTVELPVPKHLVDTNAGLRKDERPAIAVWSENDLLLVRFGETGTHTVDLTLAPSVSSASGRHNVTLDLPKSPSARLQIDGATNEVVQIHSAFGPIKETSDPHRVIADLGPTPQIELNWSQADQTVAAKFATNRLSRLEVRPEAVALVVRLDINAGNQRIDHLDFTASENLTWVSAEINGSSIGVHRFIKEGGFTVGIDEPIGGEAEIRLRFLLVESSGVGSIKLPKIDFPVLDIRRHSVAIAIEELEFRSPQGLGITEIGIEEFATMWGNSDSNINAAFDLAPDATDWILRTSYRRNQYDAQETSELTYGAQSIDVEYTAAVSPIAGIRFSYRFRVPTEVDIRRIVVKQTDRQFAPRWFRDAAGNLQVFLPEPIGDAHQISIQGTAPVPAGDHDPIEIRCLDCRESTQTLKVSRGPNLIVERVGDPADTRRRIEPEGFEKCTVTSIAPSSESIKLRAVPNDLHVSGQQVATMSHVGGKWQAVYRFDFQATSGVVDQLSFSVPDNWSEPLQLDPPLPYQLEDTGADRKRLVVWLPKATAEATSLDIVFPLPVANEVSMPQVHPLSWDTVDRRVRLPKAITAGETKWITQGLLPLGRQRDDGFVSYSAAFSDFRAELVSVTRGDKTARVALRDVAYVSGEIHDTGVATFYMQPSGATDTTLVMPAGTELLSMIAFGVPVQAIPVTENTWTVPFSSRELPHRLQVVYRRDSGSASRPIVAPTIAVDSEAADAITLWTVTRAISERTGWHHDNATQESVQQSVARLKVMETLLENTTGPANHAPSMEAWRRDWKDTALANARHAEIHLDTIPESERAGIKRTIRDVRSIVHLEPPDSATQVADEVLSSDPLMDRHTQARFAETVGIESNLHLGGTPVAYGSTTILVWLLLLLCCCGVWWAIGEEARIQATLRYRGLAVMVVGVLWWLCMNPSWPGLMLALIAAAVWLISNRSSTVFDAKMLAKSTSA